jgi:hypothetical protein
MFSPLPRASTLLRIPKNKALGGICLRQVYTTVRNAFAHTSTTPKKPVNPPDITNCSGVDLDNFVGSPGWTLGDLLPPNRQRLSESTPEENIPPETLHQLLSLSGLPPPNSPAEESKLLAALHDQLHFVRHVQSVPTEGVEPLVRIGDERGTGSVNIDGALTYEECLQESQLEMIPGLEWKEWDVCGLNGGSTGGREEGYFSVLDESPRIEELEEEDISTIEEVEDDDFPEWGKMKEEESDQLI